LKRNSRIYFEITSENNKKPQTQKMFKKVKTNQALEMYVTQVLAHEKLR